MIVLWTANTERFCDIAPGLNDTAEHLLQSIRSNEAEVSPSTVFAVASVLEGVSAAACISSILIVTLVCMIIHMPLLPHT